MLGYAMACRFSIIIPTRDRAELLGRCLEAVAALEMPVTEFEVLVVDDRSQRPPDDVMARYEGVLPLTYLHGAGRGPARARNVALRVAKGELVVFTDDDCRPHPKWLDAFGEAAESYPGAGFGGGIVDAPANGLCGRTSQMLVSFLYEYSQRTQGGAQGGAKQLEFFCSNNMAFPREALVAMGGFDESFPLAAAEDRYLCACWLKQGELRFVPGAVVEHRQMLDLRGFWRQQFRYGRGGMQFWRRREAEGAAGVRLEPWHFYSRMLLYPFGRVPFLKAVGMSVLLAVSQVACAMGYFAERRGERSV
jgi:cellulose synthase/poly-beta-1,6-N-acetylglucosamine synthase-like glycosyltransferase